MRTFFILPGFRMKAADKPFRWLIYFLKSKRYKVILVPVHWNYRTLSENIEEFVRFYSKNKSKKNYILGFSYGAIITFASAQRLKPKKIFLCSLSAAFKEDIRTEKKWIAYIGTKRFADLQTRSAHKLSRELTVPSVIFMGEKEAKQYPYLRKRCDETARMARNSRLVIVKDAPHKIDFPEYEKAIKAELARLE